RRGDKTAARILRMPPGVLSKAAVPEASSPPSLEEFAAEYDPDQILSESELLQAWEDVYPPQVGPEPEPYDKRNARLLSLRRRKLPAIDELEATLRAPPRSDRQVDGWLAAVLSERLVDCKIERISDLVRLINERGYYSFDEIPRLGLNMAQRVVQWLKLHV